MPDDQDQAQPDADQVYARNAPYAAPHTLTQLNPSDEQNFQNWVTSNKVPFDPSQKADYDMRGFYRGLASGDPRATQALNPNDNQMHFPDYWKTPYHQSFSAESQWAKPGAPSWNEKDQLVLPNGQVVFDERALARERELHRADGGDVPQQPFDLGSALARIGNIPTQDGGPILQPDDPKQGHFKALDDAFRYNVPLNARESTNVEDRRYTHPSLPTSMTGYPQHTGGFAVPHDMLPSLAAGVQGMAGAQSGPSVTRGPWTTSTAERPEPQASPSAYTLETLMQPSLAHDFNIAKWGSNRNAPFETVVQPTIEPSSMPSFRNGGGITDGTRQLLRKLKNRA